MNMNNMKFEFVNDKFWEDFKKEKKTRLDICHFSFDEFIEYDKYYKEMCNILNLDFRYCLLLRISYQNRKNGNVTEWKMLGEQIPFTVYSVDSLNDGLLKLYDTITSRLEFSMEIYEYKEYDILGLQILVYRVGTYESKHKKIRLTEKSLGESKDLVNFREVSEGFNKIIPFTTNKDNFGVLLKKSIVDGKVVSITLPDETKINIMERINKYLSPNKKSKISSNTDFYYKKYRDSGIIITVDSSIENGINKRYINIYNISGMKIQSMVDEDISFKMFTRQLGNVKLYINNKGIFNKEINITFPHVYPYKVSAKYSKMIHPDLFIGTLDIETYHVNNEGYCYAAGFYANNSMNTFYINNDLDSHGVLIRCLDAMLVEKYNKYTFYVHNLGGFEAVFILSVIIKANTLIPNKYEYYLNFRDNKIIAINISSKVNNKTYSIKLVDSYNFLQSKLYDLCKTFNTDVKKTIFPYNFVSKNTLFYKGNKPDISYYNDLDVDTYNMIPKENWSVKDQTISYLENDLVSLYQVMDTFIRKVYIDYHTQVTRSLTISSLTMDIFLREYYNNNIPLIKQKSIYNNIKNSYYGGITEVYRPYGKNLKYYDVNSLYPYSALNPMPGLNCVYIDNINKNISEVLDGLFGFYYCKIITNDNYIGLLPHRTKKGLFMPLGEIEGWYFSEELKFAYEKGYKIHIVKGYNFDKSENVFNKYIETLYNIKSTTADPVEKSIAKSKLNNLLGRFGLDINKYITELVTQEEFINILQTRRVKSVKYIEDKVLATYGKDVCPEICEAQGIDYKNLFSELVKSSGKISFKEENYHDVSIAIASAVTSYSRVYMAKIKLLILSLGGKIYYSDTDSIVTDIELPNHLVGTEIGQFKLVYEIEEGYFISNKTYANKMHDGEIVIRTKGLYSKSLNFEKFNDLYLGNNIEAIRYETILDYVKGSVAVKRPQSIELSATSYTKRSKIFNSKKLWIDTKPLYLKSNKYHTNIKLKQSINNIKLKLGINNINIIKEIFILILIAILYVVSISLSESDDFNQIDLKEFEDNKGNTINSNYTGNSKDESFTKSDNELSFFKKQLNNFLKLFNKDSNTIKNSIIKDSDRLESQHNNDYDLKIEKAKLNKDSFNIIEKIKDINLESSNQEILELKDKISLLEMEVIRLKIDNLDKTNNINSILKDIEKDLTRISKL